MQQVASHIIQKQVFLLNAAGSSTTGLEWDLKASRLLKKVIMPVVESCFEALPLEGRHFIIDKLEIDLGILLPGNLEEETRRRLDHRLSEALLEHYNSAVGTKSADTPNTPGSAPALTRGDSPAAPAPDREATQAPIVASTAQALYMALLHFLQSGTLPWWFTATSGSLADAFTAGYLREMTTGEKSTLRQVLQQQAAARIRMVNLFAPGQISELLEALRLDGHNALAQWTPLAQAFRQFEELLPLFHQQFWTSWIIAGGHNTPRLDLPELLVKTTAHNRALFREAGRALLAACRQEQASPVFTAYAAALAEYLEEPQQVDAPTPAAAPNETATGGPPVPAAGGGDLASAGNHTAAGKQEMQAAANGGRTAHSTKQDLPPQRSKEDAGEAAYWQVPDAGMVLLHPFLAELFTSNGLWEPGGWCTSHAPWQAMQLLGWLLNGEESQPEYALTLSKLLTGLEVSTALQAAPPLPASAFATCHELLEAVIGHWKALRNTGPGGLQEGFLQRPGKLTEVSNGYMLQVEQKAQDVLLAHLPWGFATVKLPWMSTLLHVSWH
ncbi:contractile injection system tape measure protein [Chitinophaga japonensis]|uniref:Uncharacterized protein n=1 Tax=Chitinophaga japonensis TaxID=104662 RepID=A0A562T2I9_CHIJA|nr:contractile injection system tape measure protein [Chitinophaga japonensis]TWI87026.1 hypothetical protein LX66_4294 [Chitinophaga japonensis]